MTPIQRANFERLLNPSHVAVIGGRDAVTVIGELKRIGYVGDIWPVNPKRDRIAGIACYQDVASLPSAPDATFLAIPAESALSVVRYLKQRGAGGLVCYTAGFSGEGFEGGEGDAALVEAVGDMALVGPNCYGVINFVDKVALWPFAHSGFCPGYGAAIITQSGMLSSDILMNQRSVPLAYMVSAGNQSGLRLEDYVELLCEKGEVRAIGLHIEGLKNVAAFSRVATKALSLNKPIVVLKTGSSQVGAQLTLSHTGSLSGSTQMYEALFKRLGIISVNHPAKLLETLKFICVSGIPKGNKILGFTCSGGGATMLADYAEKIGLDFVQPSNSVSAQLVERLPSIAEVSNPLDYTTPIWGVPDKLQPVFDVAMQGEYHSAVLVQDYPLTEIGESKCYYLSDADCFINSTNNAVLPAAVCSTLPENIDRETRRYLIDNAVTPLQGIHECLDAIMAASNYGQQRQLILDRASEELVDVSRVDPLQQVDEWTAKKALQEAGIAIPNAQLLTLQEASLTVSDLNYPLVLKMNSEKIAHKTEIGAVRLNINNSEALADEIMAMHSSVSMRHAKLWANSFLVEEMQTQPVLELMVSVRADSDFGLVMTMASGGVLIELLQDSVTLILPASEQEILLALGELRCWPILAGYRGETAVKIAKLTAYIANIAGFMMGNVNRVAELEINPLFVYQDRAIAVDALMHLYAEGHASELV